MPGFFGMGIVLLALGVAALLAGAGWLAIEGFRNGDRPLDVTVSAELRDAGQPDEPRPVVVAEIRNPSGTTVLAGLSARPARVPRWLLGGRVTVPRRTARYGLRADRHETVGVVPAGGTARFAVPVPAPGRWYWLTVVAGQAGGRLRVHVIPVNERTRITLQPADLAGWQRTW
jgi:hypothetical protein